MIVGNTIRLANKYLKNGYFVDRGEGFKVVMPSINNNIVLYCSVINDTIVGGVEVFECPCTGRENILYRFGDYKTVVDYYIL